MLPKHAMLPDFYPSVIILRSWGFILRHYSGPLPCPGASLIISDPGPWALGLGLGVFRNHSRPPFFSPWPVLRALVSLPGFMSRDCVWGLSVCLWVLPVADLTLFLLELLIYILLTLPIQLVLVPYSSVWHLGHWVSVDSLVVGFMFCWVLFGKSLLGHRAVVVLPPLTHFGPVFSYRRRVVPGAVLIVLFSEKILQVFQG